MRHVLKTTRVLVFNAICLCVLAAVASDVAWAQDEDPPLYEREPFDLLVLTDEHSRAELQVFPIDFPDRTFTRGQDAEKLRIRLLAYPDREFDVYWRDIRSIGLYEDQLLQRAADELAAGRVNSAFRHLESLWQESPAWPGLRDTHVEVMKAAAEQALEAGRYYDAWGTLDFVLQTDDSSAATMSTLFAVTDKLFRQSIKQQDFVDARMMIDRLEQRYGPQRVSRLAQRWRQQLQQLSDRFIERAEKLDADPRAALDAIEQARKLWPNSRRAAELSAKLAKLHPRVIVGVRRAATTDRAYWNEWSTRRVGRIQSRQLAEVVAVDSDGARYDAPLGSLEVGDGGRSLQCGLNNADRPDGSGLTGFDVAGVMLTLAQPDNDHYLPCWHQAVNAIDVPSTAKVHVELKRPMLRSQALLRFPLGVASDESITRKLAPYFAVQDGRFDINPDYLFKQPSQPVEIVEQKLGDGAELASALRRGNIHIADRLTPRDIESLKDVPGVLTRRYLFPSIHFLVPNMTSGDDQRLVGDRNFRRAITFAINRQSIFDQELLGGRRVEGCQLISGPFAPGFGSDDPMAYAYDSEILPRNYDPTLGVTLASLAERDFQKQAEKRGRPVPEKRAPLILLYPDDAFCRAAATAIASYLSAARIECTAQQLPPGRVTPSETDEWDLLYVDTVMSEPLLDVRRLFGEGGLLGESSPYLQSVMQRLTSATVWADARRVLREMHRIAHDELTVIPLWQWTDYYAHRDYVTGVSRRAVTLYQDVERWSVNPESGL